MEKLLNKKYKISVRPFPRLIFLRCFLEQLLCENAQRESQIAVLFFLALQNF